MRRRRRSHNEFTKCRDLAGEAGPGACSESFTEAELRVAALMVEGWDNAEIADQLCLSLNTVKKYVSRVMDKLEARNRTHAVVLMLRSETEDD